MSNILDRGLTETQARDEIYRADMRRWYPGHLTKGKCAIVSPRDGHDVAICDRRQDRDEILRMARSHESLIQALSKLVKSLADNDQDGLTEFADEMQEARASLKLAGRA